MVYSQVQGLVSSHFFEVHCMSSFGHAESPSEIILWAAKILSTTKMKKESVYIVTSNFYSNFSVIFSLW